MALVFNMGPKLVIKLEEVVNFGLGEQQTAWGAGQFLFIHCNAYQ